MLKIVANEQDRELVGGLDELVAEGARRMLIAALEAEVGGYLERYVSEVDENGHRLVVRNGDCAAAWGGCRIGVCEMLGG